MMQLLASLSQKPSDSPRIVIESPTEPFFMASYITMRKSEVNMEGSMVLVPGLRNQFVDESVDDSRGDPNCQDRLEESQ